MMLTDAVSRRKKSLELKLEIKQKKLTTVRPNLGISSLG